MSDDAARNMARRIRGGFTIVELLIVTAMIILLLSILVVAVTRASRTAQITNTRALMNSISQSLERFKEDVGYYPPVLGADRELLDPLDPVALSPDDYRDEIQQWYSVTTLADYFIGYGDDQQDAYEGIGIRHPGPDAVWGATIYGDADGSLGARNAGTGPASAGKVYGPYLQLKDERLVASTDGTMDPFGNLNVYFPGEGNYNPNDPKMITDYWGRPIRYYRTVYKPGAIKYPFRAANLNVPAPSLADVFVLRPWEVISGAETDSPIAEVGGQRDTTATYALKTAAFALFSAGPDRSLNQDVRRDEPNALNEDNIVEVGP